MSYISLDALYKIFTPSNVAALGLDELSTTVSRRDVYDIINQLFLDPNSCFYTYDRIKQEVENYFKPANQSLLKDTQIKKEEIGKFFHFIGSENRIDLADSVYWDSNENTAEGGKCPSLYDLIPSMKSGDYDAVKQSFKASAFVLRSPYVTPAAKGTDKIDMFLNYIPHIVASQMVPYLDVEFKMTSVSNAMLNTPSPLRFLLGSVDVNTMSPADRAMKDGDSGVDRKEVTGENGEKRIEEKPYTVTGVEHFLMPQTLTNMEGLGPSASRLVRAKPFLPFASILSFDVTLANAGAGKFSHKKGTLKLAIHDKGRLSEISEFIRGSSGFNEVLLWTTYGWLAPTNRENDEYVDYINRNMISRECWQIVNSQFSFDASGQVSLALEMVSKGAKLLQEIRISETDAYLREFYKVIQTINNIRSQIQTNNNFSISVLSTEILNAGSTTGVFTEIKTSKNIQAAIQNLVKSLRKSNLNQEQLDQLDASFKSLDKGGKYRHDQVLANIGRVVKKQFDDLRYGPDPFLAFSGAKTDYFPDKKLGSIVTSYNGNSVTRAAAARVAATNSARAAAEATDKEEKGPSTEGRKAAEDQRIANEAVEKARRESRSREELLDVPAERGVFAAPRPRKKNKKTSKRNIIKRDSPQPKPAATKKAKESKPDPIATAAKSLKKVVSFGKLFLNFVVPAIAKSHTCNELQVFFYALNDSCGPVSNQSVAEFPIDMSVFATAYAETLKTIGSEDMTLESLLQLAVASQFSDPRAIGYGMNNFYKPIDKENPGKPELKETKDAEEGLAQWLSEYGTFKPPMIEMVVETGEESESLSKQFMVRDLKRGLNQRIRDTQARNESLRSGTNDKKIIKRIHIYDKQCNPYRLMQSIINTGEGLELGQIDAGVINGRIREQFLKLTPSQQEELERMSKQKGSVAEKLAKVSGGSAADIDKELRAIERPGGKVFHLPKDRESLKSFIMRNIPTISVGTNGSMVFAANVASKTDNLMGAINIINAHKGNATGKATLSNNGLEEVNNLPLRAVPMQVTMTTAGVPTAQLYQTFFLDFNTGTTIDNVYNCTQIQHSITPGKFATNWTFAYTDGYGKFSSPPTEESVRQGQLDAVISDEREKQNARKNGKNGKRGNRP